MLPIAKEAFVENMETPNISKSLILFFTIAQIFTGFNFGFVKQMNNYKMAAFYFSIITGIIMSGFLACSVLVQKLWVIYAVQYFLTFLILVGSRYTVYEFMLDSKLVKIELHQIFFVENLGKIIWICGFLTFLFKFIIGAIYQWSTRGADQGLDIFQLLLLIPTLALDIIPIVMFLVFYHIYVKLKHLDLRFRDNHIDLLEVQAIYKAVLDLLDKIRSTTDSLIVLGFVTDCQNWVATTWLVLKRLKEEESWTALCCSYAYALHLTVQMCVPAMCAELMQAQADALSTLAHERLLVEQDDNTRFNLTRLVRYIRARPPLRKAWRLLPPGLKLPLAMMSMCTTTLIVVIQSTHLYD